MARVCAKTMEFTKEQIGDLLDRLLEVHPEPKCELNYSSTFELLVAVILSAQCTDKRVNEVTKVLFEKYNKPEDFAALRQEELEKLIYSCGFYRSKAAHIISCSRDITERFGGKVPEEFDSLLSLAGVGRKTANVVAGVAFGKQTMAVDTHVLRLANRIGFICSKSPLEVEKRLVKLIPTERLTQAHHLLILHGRYICTARRPDCAACPITNYCKFFNEGGI